MLPATQFSGMLVPVSTLSGFPLLMGRLFPMTYFLPISIGTFTKSLGFAELGPAMASLALRNVLFSLAVPGLGAVVGPWLVLRSADSSRRAWSGAILIAAAILGAHFIEIPAAGHLTPMENPEAFNQAFAMALS